MSPWPGTPAASTSPGRRSSTPTPSYGRWRSARSNASAHSTTRRSPAALADASVVVRRRAAAVAAAHPAVDLLPTLADADATVVEMAAWACGEREDASAPVVGRLGALASGHSDALVREAAVAALGAIGVDEGLPTILAATHDKPAIRRRAVLALSPFLDPGHPRADDVAAALAAAATDRDWQVRQAAEDITPTPDD